MDTQPVSKEELDRKIAEIRAHMPSVYESIQRKAQEIGSKAYGLVRAGLRGVPNSFYAFERGRVVGTPFAGHPIAADVASVMVQFECAHVCMWGEVSNGTH
ncbi:MAG: hypothetical protein ACR2IY_04140 [Rubrivivax sp.]